MSLWLWQLLLFVLYFVFQFLYFCTAPRSLWVFFSCFGVMTNSPAAFPGSNKTQWWVLDYAHSKRTPRHSSSGLCCPQLLAMNEIGFSSTTGGTNYRVEADICPHRTKATALQLFPVFIFDDSITHCLWHWRARIPQQHWPTQKVKSQAAKESNQVSELFPPREEVEQVYIQRLINPSKHASLLNSPSQRLIIIHPMYEEWNA